MRVKRGAAGLTLGSTLLVSVIVAVLVFGLAGATLGHLNLNTRQQNLQVARNLAISAISLAIAELKTDLTFQDPILYQRQGQPESTGTLEFGSAPGNSTNNLMGEASVQDPEGRAVPAYSARLVGTGRHAGVVHRVEAIVHIPPFPYAVACSGPVASDGGLTIGSLAPNWGSDRPDLSAEALLPSDMLSNSEATEAVNLQGDSLITGDLQAAGGILLAEQVTVKGEVLPSSGQREIPRIELEDFDPSSSNGVQVLDPASEYSETTFSGILRAGGDLALSGPVLDQALIYVDGDLEVQGGVRGHGALVVTGSISIQGGVSEVSTEDQVAIMAGRGLTINGSGPQNDFFRGLVYSEGPLLANGLTVVGTLIVRDPDTEEGDSTLTAHLNDTVVVSDPDLATFSGSGATTTTGSYTLGFGPGTNLMFESDEIPSGYPSFDFSPGAGGMVSYNGTNMTPSQLVDTVAPRGPGITHDLRRKLRNRITLLNWGGPGGGGPGTTTEAIWLIRPSEFFSDGEGMRVLLWRDL